MLEFISRKCSIGPSAALGTVNADAIFRILCVNAIVCVGGAKASNPGRTQAFFFLISLHLYFT